MFEKPIIQKQIKNINKKEKEYNENSLKKLDKKRDSTNYELYKNEENIDFEVKMIYSNMKKIEKESTLGKNSINSKMIKRREKNIERMLDKKEYLSQNLKNTDSAEIGINIIKNNPFQQN